MVAGEGCMLIDRSIAVFLLKHRFNNKFLCGRFFSYYLPDVIHGVTVMNNYLAGWADIVFLQVIHDAASTNYEKIKVKQAL